MKSELEGFDSEVQDLAQKEDSIATAFLLFVLAGALFGTSVFFDVLEIRNKLLDKTVPIVECPVSFELDSPRLLKVIREGSDSSKERWIRGFVRRYVQAQFPRNGVDAETFLPHVIGRSKKEVKKYYQSLFGSLKQFKGLIDQGFYYRVYPVGRTAMRIRLSSVSRWVVEFDVVMVQQMNGNEKRSFPTLRYTIEAGEVTLDNPEGLYVVESNTDTYVDYMTGERK